jgi:cytosine/adenosine deaminase-related metal-dependent hydrolase
LENAAVTIAAGRIVAVGDVADGVPVEDLGSVALLPGLVNAHTHLEFSDLAGPIGRQGMGMVDWLRSVVEHRAAKTLVVPPSGGSAGVPPSDGSPATAKAGTTSAVVQGLAESVRHGVTTIGEIAQPGMIDDPYRAAACECTLFVELIAPLRERVEPALAAAREHLQRLNLPSPAERGAGGESVLGGLIPHAPYTVHPDLLTGAVELSIKYRAPLAMHLAESLEEIEFLRDGSGRFRELLESRRVYDPAARPRGSRPLDELRVLSRAPRALVIHGNYLDDEEIEFLGRQRERMAAVYCPRTHAWFGHAPYPLEKMLAAGAVVALGTDSRASSPDLSLLAEMRHVAWTFPVLDRATVLELGTLAGARALGREAEIGTLEPGKRANLAAIRLPERASASGCAADPHELLLDGDGEVAGTWIRGAGFSRKPA